MTVHVQYLNGACQCKAEPDVPTRPQRVHGSPTTDSCQHVHDTPPQNLSCSYMLTAEEQIAQLEAALDDERARRRDADELANRDIASLMQQLDMARVKQHQMEKEIEMLYKAVAAYRDGNKIEEEEVQALVGAKVEVPSKDVKVHVKMEHVPVGPPESGQPSAPVSPVNAWMDEVISIHDSDDSDVQDSKPRIVPATPPPPLEHENGEPIVRTTSPLSSPPDMRGRQSASSPGNSATKRRRVETSPSPSTRGSSVRKASRPSRRSRLAGSAVDPTSPVSLRPSELSNTPDSLIDRVSAIAAVPVETVAPITSGDGHPDYVTRDFLTKAYGYAPGSLVHKHKANATSFARRNVLFPQWVQNPGLPVEPGQAGTILTMRVDILEFRSLTLFVRAPVKTAMWLYMGEYEPVVCPTPLTNTEFQNLTNATRTGWAKCILGHWQQWDSFMSARTRIWLRKNGKAVTDASVTETLARHRAGKVKGGDIGLDKQDVLKAFDSGEETLLVYLLCPLSYDVTFSEDMHTRRVCASSDGASPRSKVEDEEGDELVDEPESPSSPRRQLRRSRRTTSTRRQKDHALPQLSDDDSDS